MKARPVEGLAADMALADAARRIAAVRLHELEALAPRALDPRKGKAQHDMRIAAKRLRYVLELIGPALGDEAVRGARAARRLQDVLGELRDHDELLALLRDADEPLPLTIAYVNRRRGQLYERFAKLWTALDLSPLARSLQARGDGGAA